MDMVQKAYLMWLLIILTAIHWAYQLSKCNCAKSFFISHFPKKFGGGGGVKNNGEMQRLEGESRMEGLKWL